MRKVASFLMFLLALFLWVQPTFADDPRAQAIIKQARIAIGGDDALSKLQGISIKGQFRRVFGERQMGGDRELDFQFPDKYLAEDAFNPGGMATAVITTRGLNGEQAWQGSSGGGGGMIFRMGTPGGAQATPEEMEAALRRVYRMEQTRYLVAMLITPTSSMALDYKYVGESDVEDIKADVIEVTGPDKFAVRMFFDQQSHIPLLLSYRAPKPRIVTMTRNAGQNLSPEQIKKAREDAEKGMHADSMDKPEEVDFFIRLTDHKKVNGVLLPFKFTFLTESEVSEEFEISKYQLNPPFKTDRFQKH